MSHSCLTYAKVFSIKLLKSFANCFYTVHRPIALTRIESVCPADFITYKQSPVSQHYSGHYLPLFDFRNHSFCE